jgi:DNA-directed RNA polymerase subunit RPC12/RpoP
VKGGDKLKLIKCECGAMFTCDFKRVDENNEKEIACPNCEHYYTYSPRMSINHNNERAANAKFTIIDIPDSATIEVKFNI